MKKIVNTNAIQRDELFIICKFILDEQDDVLQMCQQSLFNFQTNYIDLVLFCCKNHG